MELPSNARIQQAVKVLQQLKADRVMSLVEKIKTIHVSSVGTKLVLHGVKIVTARHKHASIQPTAKETVISLIVYKL